MTASFGAVDWGVLLGVLLATTWVGHRAAGRQATLRDFFLGGRRLPWWAVSASIVATEISAVTYISLPAVVFKPGGNITYLQIGLFGSLIARAIVGYVLVPAYYEREIYSPYDYMGARLGERVRGLTTALFALGGVLAQSARVYLTAVVLEVILHAELAALEAATGVPPLAAAIGAIGVVAVAWTWMGGIATVVWTDAILFLLFLLGIGVTLVTVHGAVTGGLFAAFADGAAAGKFQLIDTSLDPSQAYTLWIALFVASWGQVGAYGCDQLMVQRLFCCAGPREARKAILGSMVAISVTFAVALVGVGLWAYYREHALSSVGAGLVAEKADRVFPVFIAEALPAGLKGIVLAGAFAAAISSLDSILAALSQTTLAALVLPRRRAALLARGADPDAPAEQRRTLRVSRVLIGAFGVLLCAAAVAMEWAAAHYDSILDLALAMAGYAQGALLGAFALAYFVRDPPGRGLLWSAPLSVLAVLAVAWRGTLLGAPLVAGLGAALVALHAWRGRRGAGGPGGAERTLLLAGAVLALLLVALPAGGGALRLPWPWYVPIGAVVAFICAFPLDQRSSG
jgi:SSS family transporter